MASKSKRSQASRLGRRVPVSTVGEEVEAFVPPPLPPTPPLRVKQLYGLLEEAMLGIGRLRGVGAMLPDEALFLYTYVRKEALLSAQIEGTQSSLSELLRHENAALPGTGLAVVCPPCPSTRQHSRSSATLTPPKGAWISRLDDPVVPPSISARQCPESNGNVGGGQRPQQASPDWSFGQPRSKIGPSARRTTSYARPNAASERSMAKTNT